MASSGCPTFFDPITVSTKFRGYFGFPRLLLRRQIARTTTRPARVSFLRIATKIALKSLSEGISLPLGERTFPDFIVKKKKKKKEKGKKKRKEGRRESLISS